MYSGCEKERQKTPEIGCFSQLFARQTVKSPGSAIGWLTPDVPRPSFWYILKHPKRKVKLTKTQNTE